MEKNQCSFRQEIKRGEKVVINSREVKNSTNNLCYLCNALIGIIDPSSPFFSLIAAKVNAKHCGLLNDSEETCPIAKDGFSQNPETKGRALNKYISLIQIQSK